MDPTNKRHGSVESDNEGAHVSTIKPDNQTKNNRLVIEILFSCAVYASCSVSMVVINKVYLNNFVFVYRILL